MVGPSHSGDGEFLLHHRCEWYSRTLFGFIAREPVIPQVADYVWLLEHAIIFIHVFLLSFVQMLSFTHLCELLYAHSVPTMRHEHIREITCRDYVTEKGKRGGIEKRPRGVLRSGR